MEELYQGAATTIGIFKVAQWNDGQSESTSETPGVETLRDPAPPQFCPNTVSNCYDTYVQWLRRDRLTRLDGILMAKSRLK